MHQNLEESMDNHASNLVLPPQSIKVLFNQTPKMVPDTIYYAQHPAYSAFVQSANLRSKIISLIIFTKYFLFVSIKRIISYELIPAHLRKPNSINNFIGFLKKVLVNNYNKTFYRKEMTIGQKGTPIFKTLDTQGICVVNLNPYQFDKINQLTVPLINNLRTIRNQKLNGSREFSESRCTVPRPSNVDLFKAVELSLTESGILEATAKYLKRPVKIVDINPQINDKSDDFWRNFFSDLEVDPTSTAYCHRDASGGDVKVIIYLSDVNADNGPFSFTVGSHRNKPNWVDNLIQEVNDTSGCSATDQKTRQIFSALPVFLQKKCAFGNDLQTNSEAAKQILAAEWKITAGKGHAVVFDSKGIHRGGMVLNDERVVLTCVIG
ncbi:hypothetical protein TUM19329_13060 [Legionella antarctica]|uniref:Phytanoyl-CoA dioxygenase (PhyH) n=1 Tax=Legionella antarctica TaxID=2708020 RepID=A0A6F8T2Q1_9GAMM|nr:phytanoyl-CoA dioxygenase family protein [Legionella antarctica]BCA94945.1 hypothetical protein TUM19329_13060 [Legionella antarctica]